MRLLKIAAAALFFFGLLEVACRVYARHLDRQWEVLRENPDHYFRASADRVLAYELKPGCVLHKDGRDLRINRFGLRDDSDAVPQGRPIIALLGDSVVFGTGFSQEQTLGALLQRQLGDSFAVVNFGVPGYNLDELVEQLKTKNAIYHANTVVFLLNPNDFCRRNTVYEGADNGLFRMYEPARWASPWLFGKLLYRFHKGGIVSPGWYRWIYRGQREHGIDSVREMARYCAANGASFTVVLLPAGCAYVDGTYVLKDLYDDLRSALEAGSIRVVDPVDAFGDAPQTLFTDTDHLQAAGNARTADLIARALHAEGSRP